MRTRYACSVRTGPELITLPPAGKGNDPGVHGCTERAERGRNRQGERSGGGKRDEVYLIRCYWEGELVMLNPHTVRTNYLYS